MFIFIVDLGPLPLHVADDLDLTGTVVSMSVTKATVGILPPFDGPDYGSIVVPDTPNLSTLIPELKQGIPLRTHHVTISNTVSTHTNLHLHGSEFSI